MTWKELKAGLTMMVVFLLGALVLAAGENESDQAPAKEVGIIVTHDAGRAWFPLNPPEGLDGAARFKKTLEDLAGEYPGDLKISLGGFSDGAVSGESAYQSEFVAYYSTQDFDALNVTPEDYRNYGAAEFGFASRPPHMKNLFIGNLNPLRIEMPIQPTKIVEAGGHQIKLVSLGSIDDLSGLIDIPAYTTVLKPADVLNQAAESFDGTLVLLSSFESQVNDEFARQHADLDVIIERKSADGKKRKVGSTIILGSGRPGTLQRIVLKYADGEKVEDVDIENREWASAEEYGALRTPGLPIIGMSVQPPEAVTARFDVKQENVQIDVHRDADYPSLTARKNIYVYHLNAGGNQFHFYRVYHRFEQQRGWIPIDMLVLIDPDHTIRSIETNLPTYPLNVFSTNMGTVLKGLYGKSANMWEIDPDLIRGYEESANLIIDDLRKTLALDLQLYRSGYLEPNP